MFIWIFIYHYLFTFVLKSSDGEGVANQIYRHTYKWMSSYIVLKSELPLQLLCLKRQNNNKYVYLRVNHFPTTWENRIWKNSTHFRFRFPTTLKKEFSWASILVFCLPTTFDNRILIVTYGFHHSFS